MNNNKNVSTELSVFILLTSYNPCLHTRTYCAHGDGLQSTHLKNSTTKYECDMFAYTHTKIELKLKMWNMRLPFFFYVQENHSSYSFTLNDINIYIYIYVVVNIVNSILKKHSFLWFTFIMANWRYSFF